MRISRISRVLRRRSVADIRRAVIAPCQTLGVRYLGDGHLGSVAQNCPQKVLIDLVFYDLYMRHYMRHDGDIQLLRRGRLSQLRARNSRPSQLPRCLRL